MNGRRDFRPDERRGRSIADPCTIIEGFLNEDMEAATDPLTGATMATGTLIAWQQDEPSTGQDQGDWDASTNTPTLSDGSGAEDDFFRVSVSGETPLDGITSWQAGQYLKTVGGVWVRSAPEFFEVDPMTDLGEWNASTNTPTLVSSVGNELDSYLVSTAGATILNGLTTWLVGERLQFVDGVWIRRGARKVVMLVNRDTTLSGSADYYFQASKINGEFRVLWVSCSTVRP